jgi:hypothetical protein
MDTVTIKWWINRSIQLEKENKKLKEMIDDMAKIIAHQESELRRVERLQY